MSKMASIKVSYTHLKLHLLFLISLSFVVAETRRYNYGSALNPASIIFPNDDILAKVRLGTDRTSTADAPVEPEYEIPADLIDAMNNINDPELFENYFIENDFPVLDDSVADVGLKVRFGSRSNIPEEENNVNYVPRSLMPGCEPRLTLVPVKAQEAGLVLKPPCLEVPRCGACCYFGRKCLPVASETFTYSIQEAKYIPQTKRFMITNRFNVTEEHHTACKCQCDIKPEDCHSRDQIFDNTNCRCVCKNESDKFLCSKSGRQWNSESCTCDCPVVACKEGYFFNQKKCKCDF